MQKISYGVWRTANTAKTAPSDQNCSQFIWGKIF